MTITICCSVSFVDAILKTRQALRALGHEVFIPLTAEHVEDGKITQEAIEEKKKKGEVDQYLRDDLIRRHYQKIKNSDAILVVNLEKKGIRNYIGGAAFLEIGFAYILGKKIFLLNDIPDMGYTDEIRAMQPVVLHGDIHALS